MISLALDTNALIRFLERGQDFADSFARYDLLIVPATVDGEFRAGCDPETKNGRAHSSSGRLAAGRCGALCRRRRKGFFQVC